MAEKTSRTKKTNKPDLSIVIPAYREAKRIGKTLDELAKFLDESSYFSSKITEVILVVASSPDKTLQIARSKADKFLKFTILNAGKKIGKGRDVKLGMLEARGHIIVFMDADLATPLQHLQLFYEECTVSGGVVAATRNIRKHHKSSLRFMLSNLGNILFRIASGVWIEDSQCGFKMFSRRAATTCFGQQTILGWGFDMEILAIARANRIPITKIRVNDWQHKAGGTFDESVLLNGLRSLFDLQQILVNRILGRYKTNKISNN